MKRLLHAMTLVAVACLIANPVFAQYEKLGGVYYAYPIESGTDSPQLQSAPAGYEPFYISHYG